MTKLTAKTLFFYLGWQLALKKMSVLTLTNVLMLQDNFTEAGRLMQYNFDFQHWSCTELCARDLPPLACNWAYSHLHLSVNLWLCFPSYNHRVGRLYKYWMTRASHICNTLQKLKYLSSGKNVPFYTAWPWSLTDFLPNKPKNAFKNFRTSLIQGHRKMAKSPQVRDLWLT